ncbi:Antigen 5 like allergen Cul n 1 [Pseudolycoriella hygida]|uniref:Antigen 5 like allergen Cul n 1 n=1 Tax=Pseudolycoriella hygida TaxID=35572 RepID=A0A9Q0MMX9_9DIPT|nr:Antigen 5 like allergen Cul n 1 [Pseudolycoriella hygida]
MAQIFWSDELAFLAELNTKQCKMNHDACRNTNNFIYSGQNLGSMGVSGAHYQAEYVINDTISRWYNEHPYATQSDMDLLTRISNERTSNCCWLRHQSLYFWSLMACNYASTNMLQVPVYRSGTAASYCTLGKDAVFPGLCTAKESINPNSFN